MQIVSTVSAILQTDLDLYHLGGRKFSKYLTDTYFTLC